MHMRQTFKHLAVSEWKHSRSLLILHGIAVTSQTPLNLNGLQTQAEETGHAASMVITLGNLPSKLKTK